METAEKRKQELLRILREGAANKGDDKSKLAFKDFQSLMQKHKPTNAGEDTQKRLHEAFVASSSLKVVVMALDIRKSTFLMKESASFERFATIISGFVEFAKKQVTSNGGWFDKFTGDGFLAYWFIPENIQQDAFVTILGLTQSFINEFNRVTLDQLRRNVKNFPKGVGIGVGIDSGEGYLVKLAGDITIMGAPVVGAVRMEQLCELPSDVFMNVWMGEVLYRAKETLADGISIERCYKSTKEYPEGVEVYQIRFA